MSMFISRAGLIAKKIGMSSLFIDGKLLPVTLIEVPVNYIIKKVEKEEFDVVKLGVQAYKNVNKPQVKECEKNGAPACSLIKEFKTGKGEIEKEVKEINLDFLKNYKFVDVTNMSIGKGFAGGMKRWNFKGLPASHGASLSHRSIGSTGTRDCNFKGKKMPGRLGNEKITVQNLKIVDFDSELNLFSVLGCVPGHSDSYLYVRKAVKKGLSK